MLSFVETQNIDNPRERWGWMPPTGIVEVVALEWGAPVLQYAHEPSLLDVRGELLFWEECNAQTCKRREHNLGSAIENNLPINANIQLLASALELPDVQPAVRREAYVDAAVRHQVSRCLRRGVLGEIRR